MILERFGSAGVNFRRDSIGGNKSDQEKGVPKSGDQDRDTEESGTLLRIMASNDFSDKAKAELLRDLGYPESGGKKKS